MDVSQEQVDGLVSALKRCWPKCWYVVEGGKVRIVGFIPREPYFEKQQTPHDAEVLYGAVKQKRLKKGKLFDLGIVSSHKTP